MFEGNVCHGGFDLNGAVRVSGRVLDQNDDAIEVAVDDDNWMRAQLDGAGRTAVAGKHMNRGYSGYIVLALHAEGGRRKLLRTQAIFPLGENAYATQSQRRRAETEVRSGIDALSGEQILKVRGGWMLQDQDAAIERMLAKLAEAPVVSKGLGFPLALGTSAKDLADPAAKRRFQKIVAKKTKRRMLD